MQDIFDPSTFIGAIFASVIAGLVLSIIVRGKREKHGQQGAPVSSSKEQESRETNRPRSLPATVSMQNPQNTTDLVGEEQTSRRPRYNENDIILIMPLLDRRLLFQGTDPGGGPYTTAIGSFHGEKQNNYPEIKDGEYFKKEMPMAHNYISHFRKRMFETSQDAWERGIVKKIHYRAPATGRVVYVRSRGISNNSGFWYPGVSDPKIFYENGEKESFAAAFAMHVTDPASITDHPMDLFFGEYLRAVVSTEFLRDRLSLNVMRPFLEDDAERFPNVSRADLQPDALYPLVDQILSMPPFILSCDEFVSQNLHGDKDRRWRYRYFSW